MSAALLDVNVLVALAWPNHVHHQPARRWFERVGAWATTPMTEAGFVRVSSNRHVVPSAVTPHTALDVLRRLCAIGDHVFWPDSTRLLEPTLDLDRLATSHQVTDAHLLLVAATNGGRLATLDRGVAELLPVDTRELVELLPLG